MKVYLAGDHAGFYLKCELVEDLRAHGHDVVDLGPTSFVPEDDYPDYVTPLAQQVAANPGSFGIAIGGSGQGEAMCANRVKGVRAAVFYGKRAVEGVLNAEGAPSQDGFDPVRLARLHNDANVLSLGARFVSGADASEAVRIFLATPFDRDTERHTRRIAKF